RIADGWVGHDLVLQSPRPREFRRRLRDMEKVLEHLVRSLDLHRGDASPLDRHLLHWLMNAGADDLQNNLVVLVQEGHKGIELLKHAQSALPSDKGQRRPMDEDRFIIYLAELFEASGGRATAYRAAHSDSGYANTPFRRFIHEFYRMLPLASRRTQSGLD